MKKLVILALLLALLMPNGVADTLGEKRDMQYRLLATAYDVYGNAMQGKQGIFRFNGHNDFDLVFWYRTNMDRTLMPFEQLYFDLFTYDKLQRIFSDPAVNGIFYCYCYNLDDGDYDKVVMATITRESFERIDLEFYDELWYFDYLDIREANRMLFPQLLMTDPYASVCVIAS